MSDYFTWAQALPTIPYDRLLLVASEAIPFPIIDMIVQLGSVQVPNTKLDVSVRSDYKFALRTKNKIVYVYDKRHSHCLDDQDSTAYQTTSTSLAEVLKIDYGAEFNVKQIYMIARLRSQGSGVNQTFEIQVSTDDTNYTTVWSKTGNFYNGGSGVTLKETIDVNKSARYIRFMASTEDAGYWAEWVVYKLVVTHG